MRRIVRLSLAPRCHADADRYLGQLRFVLYITQNVSQRYPLRGFHGRGSFQSCGPLPPMSFLTLFHSFSLAMTRANRVRATRRNSRFIIICEKNTSQRSKRNASSGRELVLLLVQRERGCVKYGRQTGKVY